ncbi:ABC transporter permease [Hyphomicrobium sp. MC1]|uniref:ABC transporter permease n=1 Tax=Hyphomicrobium sp. (strain MC1) TaxID=717785 RepID=UPI000213EF8C|nr:ABC transporter permease [Hyphomicrobium sp. MC1]CCB65452.1 ABC transporter, permease [Hyphomicrobium sp. MC1]
MADVALQSWVPSSARRLAAASWFAVGRPPTPRARTVLGFLSFVIPIVLWCLVSYVPFVWHPLIEITNPGSVSYFDVGMRAPKDVFADEFASAVKAGRAPPEGRPANPVYLPAPDEVAKAFWNAVFPSNTEHQSLLVAFWHSVQIIFWAFLISSALGVPLGILCGAYATIGRLTEPFVEFFRYLPAPAFGALAVAVLGIYDGPKIAIVVIGTFFQQVLIIASTTRRVDYALLEAAQTLGARRSRLLRYVVVPAVLPDLYGDLRILLGWAWTYLIVAELVGTSSGITFFITQQARYQHFDNVYAAILILGVVGFGSDLLLARLGRWLFPWRRTNA